MTAEVAILNKLAVALAADSAVTIHYQDKEKIRDKIYNSANKLFRLSDHHPVGIMIYGSAEFMETPWETVFKAYRSELRQQTFPTLREYAENFLGFLQKGNAYLFSPEQQARYYARSIGSYFYKMRKEIDDIIEKRLAKEPQITEADTAQIVEQVIGNNHQEWEQCETLPSVDKDYILEVTQQAEIAILEIQKAVLGELPLTQQATEYLKEICVFLAIKRRFPDWTSGVVFAGFGEYDIFPSVLTFEVEGTICKRLKYLELEGKNAQISFETPVAIVPFAQSEMVAAFMEGINPEYKTTLSQYLSELFTRYPEAILDAFPQLAADQRSDLLGRLQTAGSKLLGDFFQKLAEHQQEKHVSPVITNVANLPLAELAEMAESLVNLTSFKRRMSVQAETVAGPIDVAVISKKDGFIWIKQKHYFDVKYNPHFLSRYYREDITKGDAE
jgi:hypothetical protein